MSESAKTEELKAQLEEELAKWQTKIDEAKVDQPGRHGSSRQAAPTYREP